MNEELIKKRHRDLSRQQAIYVANRVKGLPKRTSAIMAGYVVDENSGNAEFQVEESPKVQRALAVVRGDMAQAAGVTKEDVLAGLLEAFDVAKTLADPQAMVRAMSEVGKMLGYYAAEKKQVEHNLGKATLDQMKALSDADLMKIAKGRVIEGEAKQVKEDDDGGNEGSESDV